MYILANVLVWLGFILLGSIPLTVAIVLKAMQDPSGSLGMLSNPNDLSGFGLNDSVLFLLVMMQFVIGFLSVWFAVRVCLKRPFKTIMTGFDKFRWNRFLSGFGVWLVLMGIYSFILWLVEPEMFKYTFESGKFLVFLPLALILVPIQSSFEELAFRGLLTQTVIRFAPKIPWLALLLQGVLFGLIHSMNPEVSKYGFLLMMSHYIGFGLILGAFAWMDEGAEISMGIHSANNLFSFVFLSYEGIALPSPSVFQQTQTNPGKEFIAVILMAVITFFILLWKKRGNLTKGVVATPENL